MLTTAPTATPLADRNTALLSVYRLMRHYAKRMSAPGEVDDVAQDAAVLFLRKFQPGRSSGAGVSAYVRLVTRQCAARYRRKRCREQSLDSALIELRGEPAAPRPEPPQPDDDLEALRAAVACLSPAMQKLVADRFGLTGGKPKKLHELGAESGVVAEMARLRVKKALRVVRGILSALGEGDPL